MNNSGDRDDPFPTLQKSFAQTVLAGIKETLVGDKSTQMVAALQEILKSKQNVFKESDNSNSSSLTVDVNQVALGITTDAKPNDLGEFLKDKGLAVKGTECLTRPELIAEGTVR